MFLEILVASSCLSNNQAGCSQATSAYYKGSTELQALAKQAEQIGQHIIETNQWLVWTATPVYALSSGQTARFNIYKNVVIGVNPHDSLVFLELNY